MGQWCLRRLGVRAKVCLLVALLLVLLSPRRARAQAFEVPESAGEPGVVVYPAADPGPHRITVVLHGMCGHAENICRVFASQATAGAHLICPRATSRCDGGGASWPQTGFAASIERAVERAKAQLGERVDESQGRTLIGYSLGAFRALELAQHAAGKYPRVMLLGARINPSYRLLRDNGVERLLLSAGAADMTFDHMRRESARLSRAGMTSRFLGLGSAGHAFRPEFAEQYLPEAWRWLSADG
jgi:predicted esterase